MAHIPTPAYTPTFDKGGKKMGFTMAGEIVTAAVYFPHGTWPDCDRCKQSCESVYAGKPTCRRCTSARRLNA